jgi:ABC-type multidrug transport system fused ATPase/permease subunit
VNKPPRADRAVSEAVTTAAAALSLIATLFGAARGDPQLAILALIAMVLLALNIGRTAFNASRAKEPPTLPARIEELAGTLTATSDAIRDIEKELATRRELVKRLEEDATRYEELAKVNEEGFKAITEMLRKEFQASEKRSLRATAMQGFFFFVLGVAATATVALLSAQ